MKKAIDKRIQEEFPEAARASVLAPSEAAFRKIFLLLLRKYASHRPFCAYMRKEWQTKLWYEGVAVRVPSTNNALESFNRIKRQATLRMNLPLATFLDVIGKQNVQVKDVDGLVIAPRDGTQLPEDAEAKIVPAKWREFADYKDSLRVVHLPGSASDSYSIDLKPISRLNNALSAYKVPLYNISSSEKP